MITRTVSMIHTHKDVFLSKTCNNHTTTENLRPFKKLLYTETKQLLYSERDKIYIKSHFPRNAASNSQCNQTVASVAHL